MASFEPSGEEKLEMNLLVQNGIIIRTGNQSLRLYGFLTLGVIRILGRNFVQDELAASQENLKIQLAKEMSKIFTISESEIRFFLSRLSSGNFSEKRYKKALINIFINRIYLYDDGRADIYFNTQETPFAVDISNIDFNETSQIEGSCATRNGSTLIPPSELNLCTYCH